MRTVFLGTSEFAVSVLRQLSATAHRPALVITRPDRPRGRGRRPAPAPVALAAPELGLKLAQPESVNDPLARERIAAAAPEALIVCAFGAIIREPLLSEHELLNVHPSLLPRWRGAAPIERAIMAGDTHTGVSIMRLTAGLDSGPVCLTAPERIDARDTYGTLSERLAQLAGALLVEAIEQRPLFREQPPDGVSYAEKITATDRMLDPAHGAEQLERVVRALHPHIGARVTLPGRADPAGTLGVLAALVAAGGIPVPAAGRLGAFEGRLLYGTSAGALELTLVQPAGGRPMSGEAYVRGHAL